MMGSLLEQSARLDETEAFLSFFKRALAHIIALNQQGIRIKETYSSLLLTRILTSYPTGYVDLQSPAGIGLGAIVCNYDGKVYSADEGRMPGASTVDLGTGTNCFFGSITASYIAL